MRAIGFSNISTKKEMDVLIGKALHLPTNKKTAKVGEKITLVQVDKDFGAGIGLSVIGEYDEKGFFHVEYTFPYLRGSYGISYRDILLERHTDKEAYSGICENINLGVSMIFYLQNIGGYVERSLHHSHQYESGRVVLAGLSREGKVILPIQKNEGQRELEQAGHENRNQLIRAAKEGNMEALESLTLEDMDMYAIVSRRIKKEDILSIVDSSFIPYGIESDHYSIIGSILNVNPIYNVETGEKLYSLLIECNQVIFDVCINSMDLLGEPLAGRRFKGVIWLQGKVDFL